MFHLKYFFLLAFISFVLFSGCGNGNIQALNQGQVTNTKPLLLTSPAFRYGERIPAIYTCDSTNISPPLHWTNTYKNTTSFALIMNDPDAPMGTWIHWVVYNIPATDTSLAMHFPSDTVLANGTKQGYTSFQLIGYGGPCPPDETHRYFFQLYALDCKLTVRAGLTKTQLLNAMKGHILGETELMGKYSRTKNSQ